MLAVYYIRDNIMDTRDVIIAIACTRVCNVCAQTKCTYVLVEVRFANNVVHGIL